MIGAIEMKILLDIDPNVYARLYDCGIEISAEDIEALATAIRNGDIVEDYEVDHDLKRYSIRKLR